MMLSRFLGSEDGSYSILFAVASLPLLAAVGTAIDFVSFRNDLDTLQNALDTAALAIATRYVDGMPQEELERAGIDFFTANSLGLGSSQDQFEYRPGLFDTFGASVATESSDFYVTVSSGIAHQGLVAGLNWQATKQSVARVRPGPPACVLALNPHAASSVLVQGSADIALEGCVIASNSDSSTAVARGGSAKISADCVSTVGGTSGLSGSSNADLECPTPLERQYASFDPLASVAPPSYGGCTGMPGGKTKTLSPGTYCDKTFSGEITLEPGIYILRGGEIRLGGNGSLIGKGVTIFLMEDAQMSIEANQMVQLSPPATGPYAGITLFQPAVNKSALTVNGTSGSYISGYIYAPGAEVFYAGNSIAGDGGCLRIVADTVELIGNSAIRSDCSAELGDRATYAGRHISLVR